MMTLNQVVADTKMLRPTSTTFSDNMIAKWAWSLEQKVVNEVYDQDVLDGIETADWDKPLSVSGTYEGIYTLFAIAQVDYYLQEYEAYNNSVAAFNGLFDEFRRWYIRSKTNPDIRWKGVM